MRIVVGLIRDGIGAKSLARRLGVSKETTREWLLSYRIGGEAALMGEREGNRKYDYETKLAAVLDHLERGMSRPEVMERYGIASRTCLKQWCQDYRRGGPEALRPKPKGRPKARNPNRNRLPRANSSSRRRTRISRRGSRIWKKPAPCWRRSDNREKSVIVSTLAGLGHPLRCLLKIAGLARSTYYYLLSHPEPVTRPDIEPMVAEVFHRTPNGCGHRQVRMCLVYEFGVRVSHKSVLRVMRRMGLKCAIRRPNPYRRYSSYQGDTGAKPPNLLERDFAADRPWVKLGTDVTEFRAAGGKAYLAPIYDMGSKEIVAWDVSRHPDLAQQQRLLAMLEEKLPEGADPILHSDMDGNTSTTGGGTGSGNWASASP